MTDFKGTGGFQRHTKESHLLPLAFPEASLSTLTSFGSQPVLAECSGSMPKREVSYSILSTFYLFMHKTSANRQDCPRNPQAPSPPHVCPLLHSNLVSYYYYFFRVAGSLTFYIFQERKRMEKKERLIIKEKTFLHSLVSQVDFLSSFLPQQWGCCF